MSGANASPSGRSNQEMSEILDNAKFGADGLIPAIIQDARTREVLTVAYMNKEALQLTLERRETYLWSRSRQKLWHKGETSGNSQKVTKVTLDCDNDAVLVEVEPLGPACHTGSYSCFGVEPELEGVLQELYSVIEQRKEQRPEGSYTTYLFNSGLDKILKKVGEESTETIVAAKNSDPGRLVSETGDLIYHLLVLLVERGITLDEIAKELKGRRK
jgi:phosphoribosyl-ATP pyrophosphohydrolase/phosphoribosyl-AMP cyclohydrolase